MFALRVNGLSAEAIDELVQVEAKNPAMADHLRALALFASSLNIARAQTWLETIESETPYPNVKAMALLASAYALLGGTESKAVATLKTLLEKYPDAPAAAEARAMLFKYENLQVGNTAPDLISTDEQGQKITLSEYRGKVVFLHFWSPMWPLDMAKIPEKLALQKALSGKPFVLLGICCEDGKSDIKPILDKQQFTWRQFIGKPDDPNSPIRLWNFYGNGGNYLLDHRGVIRYTNLSEDQVEKAARTLLAEMERN